MGFKSANIVPISVADFDLIEPVCSQVRWSRIDLYRVRGDDFAGRKHDGTRDHIFQFPNIPRPVMSHDFVERVRANRDWPLRAVQESLNQKGDVLLALPQGG